MVEMDQSTIASCCPMPQNEQHPTKIQRSSGRGSRGSLWGEATMRHRIVREVMSGNGVCQQPPGASVRAACRLMAEHRCGSVLVVDRDRLVGIFTERDVLTRIVAAGRNPDTTLVGDAMSTDLIVADVNESYEVCLARMRQAHVRHVLALQDGRLAGIVSMRDVLAADVDEKAEELTLLNAYVHYIPANITPRP
jgi:signal-transduction protein with cAMP-binding, CBS, and nucleotidyltransferase domain